MEYNGDKSLLSKEEWEAYDILSEAWGKFIKLKVLHTQDNADFALGINICKNIIMSRPVAKELAGLIEKEIQEGGDPHETGGYIIGDEAEE